MDDTLDILVIEDDEDARSNLRDILEIEGHRVSTAGTAREALDRSDWSRFSAIILDRQLPDATAEKLLPDLRRLAAGAAVIVVTGYADLQGAIGALRQGASDYILKPLNPEALFAGLARVAERRRLSLAKERSDAAFQDLVEAAAVMIVILKPDRSILYFSPFAERLTGKRGEDVRGTDYIEVFVPTNERAATARTIDEAFSGRLCEGYEHTIIGSDGEARFLVCNARVLPDYEGTRALLLACQDITGVKQAQARALQTERLAAIGQMVAGLAHESRNALQRSQACLELLALSVKDRPELLDLIARIQKAQDDLHYLYEDVRGYAAPIHLERVSCDPREVWREVWGHLERHRASKNATLIERAGGVDLRCAADPFRLGQVFRNILENALAAAPASGRIEIEASDDRIDGRPALTIAVTDNGPGFAPETHNRAFEPFFTTKAKGTGLGLPIAQRIIEAHGGRLSIGEALPGLGATFIITLPRD